MIEKLLCLDVPIAEEHQKKFQEIRERALELHSKSISFGLVVYEEDRDNSWLKGGEVTFVRGVVGNVVEGTILGIDGILPDGVNVAVGVGNEEVERLRNQDRFAVRSEYKTRRNL